MRTESQLVVLDPAGNGVAGANVTINIRGGGRATIYQFETGGSTLPNPITTDGSGRVEGWIERGAYDAIITAAGMSSYTERFESTPARDGSIDSTWLADNAVIGSKLADLAVTTPKLADNAVTTPKLADSSVTGAKLAPGAVASVASVPTGAIISFGGGTAPSGWLLCDGSLVSRATYSDLFAILGTAYGVGDGSTTFGLPDLRQRFALGKAASGTGNALGQTGGTINHVHSGPSHSHSIPAHSHGASAGGNSSSANVGSSGAQGTVAADGHSHSISIGAGGNNSDPAGTGNTGTGNPPYQVVNHIVKT